MNQSYQIKSCDLYQPSLDSLVPYLSKSFSENFCNVEISIQNCPDLRQYNLPKSGISGSTVLVDVGGVPHLMNPQYHNIQYKLSDIASLLNLKGKYVIGAAACDSKLVQTNAEFIPCEDLTNKVCKSRVAKVLANGDYQCDEQQSDSFGLLGNLFFSEGKTENVLRIKVSKEKSHGKNFVAILRDSILQHPDVGGTKQVGAGGVILINHGKIKAHIMPDFKQCHMSEGPEVEEWLRYYEMGPNLICMAYFVTGDPSEGQNMNLRLDHTHFISFDGKQGGHYHYAVTNEEIEYEAYISLGEKIYRVDDAFVKIQSENQSIS